MAQECMAIFEQAKLVSVGNVEQVSRILRTIENENRQTNRLWGILVLRN